MNQKFPNGEIKSIQGRSFTMKGDDIDTDRIIPARFLKCVSFSALGEQVFADDRKEIKGNHPFDCLLYTSPSPRDVEETRMPSSA